MAQEKKRRLAVKVVTGAAKTALAGMEGENLRIRLAAPPVDGKANAALMAFLAEKLSLPKSSISIRSGATARRKLLEIEGCSDERLKDLFSQADAGLKQK